MSNSAAASDLTFYAGARVFTAEDVGQILDVFQAHGHYEVCDVAFE